MWGAAAIPLTLGRMVPTSVSAIDDINTQKLRGHSRTKRRGLGSRCARTTRGGRTHRGRTLVGLGVGSEAVLLSAVPYFGRRNRAKGAMEVWISADLA